MHDRVTVKTVTVTHCPYHEMDFTQERFISEMQTHYYNQTNPLGVPLFDYPQWLSDGMIVRSTVREAFNKQKAAHG